MSYDFEKIYNIFYSGPQSFRGEKEQINEIYFLIKNGYLIIKEIKISSKNEYLSLIDDININKYKYNTASGGGDSHIALKILSLRYLKEERGLDAGYEQPFCGYFPDVLSLDNSTVIECGNTQNPEKIINYFLQGNIIKFIQVPYPTREDEIINGYCFSAGPNLHSFLESLNREKFLDTKKIFKSLCR